MSEPYYDHRRSVLARGMMRTNTGEITRVVTGHVAADLAHSVRFSWEWIRFRREPSSGTWRWQLAYSDEGVFTS